MGDDDVDVILCIRIHGGVFESRRSSDMELIAVTIWLEDHMFGLKNLSILSLSHDGLYI